MWHWIYLSFVVYVLLDDIFGYGLTLIHLKAGGVDSKKLGSLIMVVSYKHKTYFAPIYIIVCFQPWVIKCCAKFYHPDYDS